MNRVETKPRSGRLELAVERLLPAPRAVVWKAWTDPRQIERWWHPAGFRRATCERLDLRVGGGFRIAMPAEDGTLYTAWGTYREIVPERKLAYDDRCDRDGRTFHAASLVVLFEDSGTGRTRLSIRTSIDLAAYAGTGWTPAAIDAGWTKGWADNLDGLARLLSAAALAERPSSEPSATTAKETAPMQSNPSEAETLADNSALAVTTPSEREIVLKRSFGAPPAVVWDVITKPEHVRHWYGCDAMTMAVCEIDLKVGGQWRYLLRMADGSEHGFHGVYKEIQPPYRLVSTEVYEPFPDAEAVVTVTLEERDGRTELTSTVRHATKEARDGHLNAGMEQGAGESYRRLDREAMAEAEKRHAYSLTVSREIAAPRQLVWDAWTKPEHTDKWGPAGYTVEQKNDPVVRVGGKWRAVLKPAGLKPAGKGGELWQGGVYREVKEPERLVFTFAWDQETGLPGHEMLITLIFEALAKDRTRLTLRQDFLPNLAERDGHAGGWGEALDALKAHLEKVVRG